jgi:cytosine/adenosine deaminase-related metal-dependent hydrolase
MILRARIVLPITAPPIEDGAVFIAGNRIRSVSPFRDLRPHVCKLAVDLGDVIVLPGLVNAHCHLDYTDMAGKIPPPKAFNDWIAAILAFKADWSYSDYARSWLRGAQQLLRNGTTTVADIEAMPDLLPEVWETTPLRVISFLEMTGIKSGRPPKEILRETVAKIESLKHPRHRAALSPHAPYSTRGELLRLTAGISRRRKIPASIHVAESIQEFEMFRDAKGKMYQWLARNGRDNSDCGLGSPVAHLARNQLLGDNVLAVHVNYLARGDATLLAKNRTHVVHCPRSHDYFRHRTFERERLAKAGVNLCLGTDSLATTRKSGKPKPELDMFAEMRTLADDDKSISPGEILAMATVNGARALGLRGKIGELAQNSFADLITIPFTGKSSRVMEGVLEHSGDVLASMIEGRWAITPAG